MVFNTQFGRYTLVKKVAVGGMADVYLALKRGPSGYGRVVALKLLHEHLAQDRANVERFYREARLAAGFDHPNLIPVFDAEEIEGRPALVMPFVEGGTLEELVKKMAEAGQPLEIAHALHIASHVAAGLHEAHTARDLDGTALGIVHRDVSPHNILLGRRPGEVRLFDFGVAITASSPPSGALAGKTAYMSPEQCRGKALDARSDIFALGIVLHELLTGAPLFKRENHIQTIRAITEEDAPAPSTLRGGVSADLDALVLKALSRDPAKRFASAREFQEAIRALLPDAADRQASQGFATLIDGKFRREFQEFEAVIHKALSAPMRSESTIDLSTFELGAEQGATNSIHTDQAGGGLGGSAAGSSSIDGQTIAALGKQIQGSRRINMLLGGVVAVLLGALAFLFFTQGSGESPAATEAPVAEAVIPDVQITLESIPPGAAITIDGIRQSDTTPTRLLVPAQEMIVELDLPGYFGQRHTLSPRVGDADSTRLTAEFEVDPESEFAPIGVIQLSYEPEDAVVFLAGEQVASSSPALIEGLPLHEPLELRIAREGFETRIFTVNLSSGDMQEFLFVLAEATDLAVVRFVSRPPRAMVWLNGEEIGETPLEGLELVANQPYTIEMERRGYQRWRRTITPLPGDGLDISAVLDPLAGGGGDDARPSAGGDRVPTGGDPAPTPPPAATPEPERDRYQLLLE